jgi:nucleoside-diphosphate-sugar epimerase
VRVCLTGGTGFIGAATARRLLECRHAVVLLARSRARALPLEEMGASVIEGDLLDRNAVAGAVAGCEAVIHCAGVPRPAPVRVFRRVHVEGTRIVVEAARAAGARRLVHIASQAVLFEGRDIDAPESALARPARHVDPYSRTKAEGEEIALAANDPRRLETTSVRPALVWGRGDTTLLPALLRLALGPLGIPMCGPGRNLEATTHVRNAVSGIIGALESPRAPGRAYLLVDGFEIGWKDFMTRLVEAAGVKARFLRVPAAVARPAARAIDGAATALGLTVPLARFGVLMALTTKRYRETRAGVDLGYAPEVGLEEGLADLSAWVAAMGGPRNLARLGRERSRGEAAIAGALVGARRTSRS